MYDSHYGISDFIAAMPRYRFEAIKRAFRFDDRTRRDANDPISPVRDIWQKLIRQFQSGYYPSPSLAIDEQLLEYHGRVKIKQYIGTKPGKYGIKIYWLVDNETTYAVNGIVYAGAQTHLYANNNDLNQIDGVTNTTSYLLCKPVLNLGVNITGDNFFSSLALSNKLFEKKTTYVGTVRSSRRDVPPAAKKTENQKGVCKFYRNGNNMLLSYRDKTLKPVLLP